MTQFIASPIRLILLLALCLSLAACGSGRSAGCLPGACPIGPGAEYLLATTSNGAVLSLKIDQQTGGVSPAISVPGPSISLGLAAVGSKFLYVSDAGGHRLYGYSIDAATGALSALTGSPFSLGALSLPEGLAAAHGAYLYVGDAGAVDGLAVNGTSGMPTPVAGSPFASGTNLFLTTDPAGKFLFASDDDLPGGILAFTIDSATGALTAVPSSPFPIPGQTVLNSQPSGIVTDASGRYVYAALNGANQIAAFSITSGTGVLTPVLGSPFPAGMEPLTLAATNRFLYANSTDGTIRAYGIDSTTGVLTPVAGSPFAFSAAGLSIDPSGKFLFGSRLPGIEVFNIDTTNGAITPVVGSPFPAGGALQLTIVQMPGQGG